ncbi:MAG: phosphoribosyltransferase [Pseudomonadales bacterium]|nr:phosphoribosyltransferase [Candidatus Woesebacteria bacterium]MCB9801869.1 phosphoribosyltransferase [Pseudomonadales bacterium]
MNEHDYSVLSKPGFSSQSREGRELRMRYFMLTDRLIHTIQSGIEVRAAEGGVEYKSIDVVLFLDKSARPVSWLLRDLWPVLAQDSAGFVPAMPEIRYINIGKDQQVTPDDVMRLRAVFMQPKNRRLVAEGVIDRPSFLDNKTILVVDEVRATGKTLKNALLVLRRSFPTTHFRGTYWMDSIGVQNQGPFATMGENPVWYRSDTDIGRGVKSKGVSMPNGDNNPYRASRLSWDFLSRRWESPDLLSQKLREDIKHLTTHPDVPIRAHPARSEDEGFELYKRRMERLNPGLTFTEIMKQIHEILDVRR